MNRRVASSILIFLIVISTFPKITPFINVVASSKTIRVPQDYETIQEAINAASSGDTVFVSSGTYYENVVVSKAITLIGEDKNVIISGGGRGAVLSIKANNTFISGFTIRDSGTIIWSSSGIFLDSCTHCVIQNCNIISNKYGVYFRFSSYNTLSDNNISLNFMYGILISDSHHNMLTSNVIANSSAAVYLTCSFNQTITSNAIVNNVFGICIVKSCNNKVYHNNFIGMQCHVYHVDGDKSVNIWDDGYPSGGNYWSDYTGVDENHDGIGDTPYVINEVNKDKYPLMNPYKIPVTPPKTYALHVQSSPVTGIKISYSGDYSGAGTTNFDVGPKSSPFTVTLTVPSTYENYEFSYWQLDGTNMGKSTSIVVKVDDEKRERTVVATYVISGPSVPSSPRNLKATSGSFYVRLDWEAPSNIGGASIENYKIYRGTSRGEETFLTSVDGNTLTYRDETVSSNDLYYYKVTAVNSIGESIPSNEVRCSSLQSIKGIRNIVKLDDFKVSGLLGQEYFSIQQNFLLKNETVSYLVQNVIGVVRTSLGSFMFGGMEIHNVNTEKKVVHWWNTIRFGSFKDKVSLNSTIKGDLLEIENDFSSLDFHVQDDFYISSPEIIIVGIFSAGPLGPILQTSEAIFQSPTKGHVYSYVRIGGDPGTWLVGKNEVITQSYYSAETSRGLRWLSNGDFEYSAGFKDQGLRFEPNYEEQDVSFLSELFPSLASSVLMIFLACPAHLNLIDLSGKRIGYDPITGEVITQIPKALFLFSENTQSVILVEPSDTYQLSVIGHASGIYSLTMIWVSKDGLISTIYNSSEQITEGSLHVFSISIPSTGPPTVNPITRGTQIPFYWYLIVGTTIMSSIFAIYVIVRRKRSQAKRET